MHAAEGRPTLRFDPAVRAHGVWRDFVRLAMEGLGVGLFVSIVLGLAVFVVASRAHAATPDAGHAELRLAAQGAQPLVAPLLSTDVRITAGAMMARVEVTQRFHNPSADWREGVYVFPLPESAAVDHLRMRIGERLVEGLIKERSEARRAYENAKQEGRKSTLVEQQRPNVFTTSVAHIGPGEEVVVTLEYQQSLRYEDGGFSLRFPLAMTPRYVPGAQRVDGAEGSGTQANTDAVPDAATITPPVLSPEAGLVNPVSIAIDLAPGFALSRLESRYHAVAIEEAADHRYHVELADGVVPATRDFELAWTPDVGATPGAALYTESRGAKTYALLMLLPPSVAGTQAPRLPRETVFVVDTSGSMEGVSIAQAKQALTYALDRLQPGDRFNVIEFNSTMRAFAGAPVDVDAATMEAARTFVRRLKAQGGTEMRPALEAALATPPSEARVRQIVFLTDGAVGNEAELLALIQERLADQRLFTVGIGPAPNTWFLGKAAQFGRGTFTFIGDVHEVGAKMSALFRKIESPVLTGVRIDWPRGADPSLGRIPDLYAGEPLIVSAAFDTRTLASGRLRVSGRRGERAWGAEIPLDAGAETPGVGVVWARARIEDLVETLHTGIAPEAIRSAALALALEHHLVSRYTSLVAVDVTPTAPPGTTSLQSAVPVNLPEGLSQEAIFGLPQTATNARRDLVAGTLSLLLAALLLAALRWRARKPTGA